MAEKVNLTSSTFTQVRLAALLAGGKKWQLVAWSRKGAAGCQVSELEMVQQGALSSLDVPGRSQDGFPAEHPLINTALSHGSESQVLTWNT